MPHPITFEIQNVFFTLNKHIDSNETNCLNVGSFDLKGLKFLPTFDDV